MKNIMKLGTMAFLAMAFATTSTQAQLQMTGVLDGTLTGGTPKAVEVYAVSDIPNLSVYALSRAGNGAATYDAFTADFIFPNIALSAGDYYYGVAGPFGDQTGEFDSVFAPGITAAQRSLNFGVNSNGDDVTGLFFDPTGLFTGGETQVDVFGVLGVDGSGMSWEHLDSWVYRKDGTMAAGTTFVESNWTIAGANSLDGLDAAGIAAAVPFGTYSPTAIPEPGSLAVLGLFGLVGLTKRRRK